MDLFVEGCQGLGLALAVGAIAGALVGVRAGEGPLTPVMAIVSAIAGAALFGWSLTQADHPAWPGWPVGAAFAVFAFVVVGGFVAGARRRSSDDKATSTALALPVLLAAIVLAGLSLVFGPVALIALAALVYLAIARRRRAGRKYEGLRVLR
jgi:chromate transport protein ChrA